MSEKRFTYSGDPSNSRRDAVRFLTGDTVRQSVMFDDREIDYQNALSPNDLISAANLLEAKATQFSRSANVSVGGVSKALGSVSAQMFDAAKKLRQRAGMRAKPFFGGLTHSGNRSLASDPDAVQPSFSIGMDDYPGTNQLSEAYCELSALGVL